MAFVLSQKADFAVAECDGELTIFNVAEHFQQLKPVVAQKPEKLLLDLSAVQDFDSAGLQLLLWLKQQLGDDTAVQVTMDDNDVVQRLFSLYYLSDKLTQIVAAQE